MKKKYVVELTKSELHLLTTVVNIYGVGQRLANNEEDLKLTVKTLAALKKYKVNP